MSTIEATVSMLEAMPEDARIKVYEYTQSLFTSEKHSNPFVPVTIDQILIDLEVSRNQIDAGEGIDFTEALNELGTRHGFI